MTRNKCVFAEVLFYMRKYYRCGS